MSIGITVTRGRASSVVAVSGEVDLATASELEQALAGVDDDVTVDLRGCDFLDSTGLGVLVGTDNRLRSRGRTMTVLCTNPRILRIFRITRLDTVWRIRGEPDQPPTA